MTVLSIDRLVMPAASIPQLNPLPPFAGLQAASAAMRKKDDPKSNFAAVSNILPYQLQDDYDRRRKPREFKTAVLENEILRATFLLEFGGRLWSLFHKPTQRELLFVNPVFQPANLAVRDAWFSGGIEWNISVIGHSPLTCAPVFAARVQGDDGSPALRLHEWERLRGVPYQIDFIMPSKSPLLLTRVRIINPHDKAIPMYWWSNIAVPETEDTRILGPANMALRHGYDGKLVEHALPIADGMDMTYPTRRMSAADMYFRIPVGQRPWIAALDRQGSGLFQTSTDRLVGRKAFNWGMASGGRHWQEFLAQPGHAYIEIQAGLAQTQAEYVSMPANADWSWMEAYGLMNANPSTVHGDDWNNACNSIENQIEHLLPRQMLRQMLDQTRGLADRAPDEILHDGSGWGALERHRRAAANEPMFASDALVFPDRTMGDAQDPWLNLLERGFLPQAAPEEPLSSFMVQPEWHSLLEKAIVEPCNNHWLSWLHLGIMRYHWQDYAGAQLAWEKSVGLAPSAWALRNLALLADQLGQRETAADIYWRAMSLAPKVAPLAVECMRVLLSAGQAQRVLDMMVDLYPSVKNHDRIRLFHAQAAMQCGDLETVQAYIESRTEIANIREAETALSDLWYQYQEQRHAQKCGKILTAELRQAFRRSNPPPAWLDFRMVSDEAHLTQRQTYALQVT